MKLLIGDIILNRLKEIGLSKTEFARRINCSPQNAFNILDRDSIDTKLLVEISKVLDYNFFSYFDTLIKTDQIDQSKYSAEFKEVVKDDSNKDIISKLRQENEYLYLHIKYLKEINDILHEKLKKP